MSFVLDSSITLAWIYADEWTPDVMRVSQLASDTGAWVTGLWRLEVANSLLMGIRRGRIDGIFRDQALADLSELNITVDTETDSRAWTTTLAIAEHHGLTLYDASYLELATRRTLPLASLDKELRAAAQKLDVRLL
jgi:predicted nucleic acid-binding protein